MPFDISTRHKPRTTVAVVDSDKTSSAGLAAGLTSSGFDVVVWSSIDDCLQGLRAVRCSTAIVEERLADGSGFDLLPALKNERPDTVVIFLTAFASVAGAVRALRSGAAWYFSKPLSPDQLADAISSPEGDVSSAVDRHSDREVGYLSLARLEWEHVNQALAFCGGNISKTARILGVHRRSLQRKLSRYAPRG